MTKTILQLSQEAVKKTNFIKSLLRFDIAFEAYQEAMTELRRLLKAKK